MSTLSDIIEKFIKELMDENGVIDLQRNLLAQQFECSPSQINYVISTRFNNDRGYIVESRRGGGGYIKIFKVETSKYSNLENLLSEKIGESITINKANDLIDLFNEEGIISDTEQSIMKSALSDRAFKKVLQEGRNKLRADILKEMILASIE